MEKFADHSHIFLFHSASPQDLKWRRGYRGSVSGFPWKKGGLVILVPRRGGYVTFHGQVQVFPHQPHVNNEHSLKCLKNSEPDYRTFSVDLLIIVDWL